MIKAKTSKLKAGFTLLETLLYSGIVTVILTFTLITMYQLIKNEDRVTKQREMTENQKFFVEKVAWMLQSVDKINTPTLGATSTTLSLNKLGYAFNPLIIRASTTPNGTIEFLSGATSSPITNSYATATGLLFEQLNLASTSAIRVRVTFTNDTASTTIDSTFIVK